MLRLYLITPPDGDPAPSVEAALSVLPRRSAAVQLRQKLPARALLERARALKEICARFAAPLLINDRPDIALAAHADGVHLPASGMRAAGVRALGLGLVALSAHTPAEVAASGADFCVFGPVFATPGKGPAQGLDQLARACRAAPIPVLALGGIDESNAHSCMEKGAAGVACIRAVLGAKDPAGAAIRLWRALVLALALCSFAARAERCERADFRPPLLGCADLLEKVSAPERAPQMMLQE